MNNKMKVWVVNCGDTGSDEPGYIALAQVYSNKADAMSQMEMSVKHDEGFFNVLATWDDARDMAIMNLDDGRQIVYTIDEMDVL